MLSGLQIHASLCLTERRRVFWGQESLSVVMELESVVRASDEEYIY